MADTEPKKLSKNEEKKIAKAKKKAEEKAAKDQLKKEKSEKDGKQENGSGTQAAKQEEVTDPSEYFKLRTTFVNEQKKQGLNPYPHKFVVSISLTDYIENYSHLKDGDVDQSKVETISGRLHAKRESSSKLIFFDLRAEGSVNFNPLIYHDFLVIFFFFAF